jgi:pyrimidine-nucleoside phosphorylase
MTSFDPRDVIAAKRDGQRLSDAQIRAFMRGAANAEIPDDQVAALLMAVFLQGLEPAELVSWTRAMLQSGESFRWERAGGPLVDKHSTGGIGDKASLPLAPALAACGARVPMISGRGLGHTGGTLDKLEALPGVRTELASGEHQRCLASAGWFIAAQTRELVPADKRLYALRDRIAAVESIPLIASSILSKKLAEGLDALVLDVKFGSGAFLPDAERGLQLARTMVDLAAGFGLRASALLTNMQRPLGGTIGHALEIEESLDCLAGRGPADLRELVCALGGELLEAVALTAPGQGAPRLARALDDGSARERFEQGLRAQGMERNGLMQLAKTGRVQVWPAPRSGYLGCGDLRHLGRAVVELGGGRRRAGDHIDFAVGLKLLCEPGGAVSAGQPVCEIHHRDGYGLPAALQALEAGLTILEHPPAFAPLITSRLAAQVH